VAGFINDAAFDAPSEALGGGGFVNRGPPLAEEAVPETAPTQLEPRNRFVDNPVGTERLDQPELTNPSPGIDPIVGYFPGTKMPMTATQAADLRQRADLVTNTTMGMVGGIKAYHGSAASFDRFSDKFIGTGEGAQAYGRGHYFAEAEPTAMSYRDSLAPVDHGYNELDTILRRFGGYGVRPAAADVQEALSGTNSLGAMAKDSRAVAAIRELAPNYDPKAAVSGADLNHYRYLNDTVEKIVPNSRGSMYEVDINADPAHFLQWDKRLSEQSQAVQSMADKVRAGGGLGAKRLGPDATGQDLYWAMNSPFAGKALGYENWSTSGPSEHLAQAGIPGIKYLDQGSRGAGEGTHNYVVFNPETIDILRKYGIAGFGTGGAAAAASADAPPEEQP
jgi:hypothetical protein